MDTDVPGTTIDVLVDGWRRNADQPVLAIDETRTAAGKHHKEVVVFTGVYGRAGDFVDYLFAAHCLRQELPEPSRDEAFKGTDLWHIGLRNEYKAFAGNVVKGIKPPRRLFIATTTQRNLADSKASVRMVTTSLGERRGTSITGPELKIALNFILRIVENLDIHRLDVVIDRSEQLGLSPRKRRLTAIGELFTGRLKEGSAELQIVSDSDHGPLRDLLLLPDFVGNLLLRKTKHRLASDISQVTSGEGFWFREVILEDEIRRGDGSR